MPKCRGFEKDEDKDIVSFFCYLLLELLGNLEGIGDFEPDAIGNDKGSTRCTYPSVSSPVKFDPSP